MNYGFAFIIMNPNLSPIGGISTCQISFDGGQPYPQYGCTNPIPGMVTVPVTPGLGGLTAGSRVSISFGPVTNPVN